MPLRGRQGGNTVPERDELEQTCRALLHLFPTSGAVPRRWTGYSFVVWTKQLTGKEQLKMGLDKWLREVEAPPEPSEDEIPF